MLESPVGHPLGSLNFPWITLDFELTVCGRIIPPGNEIFLLIEGSDSYNDLIARDRLGAKRLDLGHGLFYFKESTLIPYSPKLYIKEFRGGRKGFEYLISIGVFSISDPENPKSRVSHLISSFKEFAFCDLNTEYEMKPSTSKKRD